MDSTERGKMLTGKVPRLELVDINHGDVVIPGEVSGDLALQVEDNQLFVSGVESEAGTYWCHGLDSREMNRSEKKSEKIGG